MASLDLCNNVYGEIVIPINGYTETFRSTAVNMEGFESLTFFIVADVDDGVWDAFLLDSGALNGEYELVKTQDETEPTDGSFGVIGDIPHITVSDTQKVYRVGYCGNKQFVKIELNTVGGVGTFVVLAVKGHPRKGPTLTQSD